MSTPTSPRSLLMWAIQAYQQHLSPHKGYGCAHRLHHGKGSGCSGVGLRAIRRHGSWRGLHILRERLKRCGEVAHAKRAHRHKRFASQRGDCDCGGDCLTLPFESCGEIGMDALFDRCKAWWKRQPIWVKAFLSGLGVAGLLALLVWGWLWWQAP